jgi:hypothetical protein
MSFQFNLIKTIDLMENSFKVVIPIRPFSEDMETDINFCVCSELHALSSPARNANEIPCKTNTALRLILHIMKAIGVLTMENNGITWEKQGIEPFSHL